MTEVKVDLDRLAKFSGKPWTPTNNYFVQAEEHMDRSWNNAVWPFISECDFDSVVDLAAGHGRNTQKLLNVSGKVFVLDIQPGNIDVCRERFRDYSNVDFAANNGFDLAPVPDAWATLVYCFDAMVHFDSDVVRSYLRDTRRVLAPAGSAFFHHSNYTEGTSDWTRGKGSRNFMSADLFRHYAEKEGLVVVKQKVIDWAVHKNLDCLTLVARES